MLGAETAIVLPIFANAADDAKFRARALAFIRAHEDHVAIQKLCRNKALTKSDLVELERMLIANGVAVRDRAAA